jgi:hypothetical protein
VAGVLESPVFPLGLPDPNLRLIGVSHTDTVTFGSGAVAARIGLGGSALVDGEAIGSGSIAIGPVILAGTGISDTTSLGSGGITVGSVSVVDDETDHFAPTLGSGNTAVGPVSLSGAGIQDLPSFGVGVATIGGITVLDDEDDNFPATLGNGSLDVTYTIPGTGLTDTVTFGAGVVSPGPIVLDGYGIWPNTKYGRGTVQPTRYYFVGPELRYAFGRKHSPLWWVENAEGVTVLRENGVWRETLAPTGDEIAAAERAYRGGYRTELTGTQKNELVAAGYGSYIEED